MKRELQHRLLFWLGVAGLIFYAVGPIFLPHAPIREPELLPVYTTMMGVGSLIKHKNQED